MKNFLIDCILVTGLLLGLLIVAAMGDAPIETDEEIQSIALAEQASQKAEFNRLALEAYHKTGYVARME